MNLLRRVKIGARLGLGFGIVLLLTIGVGGFGVLQTSRINDDAVQLGTNWLPSVQLLGDIRASVNAARRAALRHVLEADAGGKQKQQATRDEILKTLLAPQIEAYTKLVSSDEESRLLDALKARLAASLALDQKLIDLSNGGDAGFVQARQLAVGESAKGFAELMTALGRSVALNAAGAKKEVAEAAETHRQSLLLTLASVAAALVFGSLMAWAITRSITAPIRQSVRLAETVARGDLTATVAVTGRDEATELLAALARMSDQLANMVGQVRRSSDSIATGSSQIATGNADLSQRTEEQASNLQQTAASMEQLTGTVKSNAATAQQADQLAEAASAAAARGGQAVGQVVATMDEISSSSKRIADIVGVIDGIAFQTNILALNAAVEAARAGEQGRGFAVVASEVRSLAQRSAQAAKEIKQLIGTSVDKVGNGARLVAEAGLGMSDIVSQVKRVSELISQISHATAEQTSGIGQVGDAVTQLDKVTQQNAALVEQSAAAAESLKLQAAGLTELVSVFRIRTAG